MRSRPRKLVIILVALAVASLIGLAVYLRKLAPPEPARLLPEAEGFIYVNLGPLRRAELLKELPPVVTEPEYGEFVRETGFQFERDLDEVAFAVHAPTGQLPGSEGRVRNENRYSEVFVGRFNAEKLSGFLRKLSQSLDTYRNISIFNIPHQGRMVRVAIISPTMVAASNNPDPGIIRSVIDRSKKLAMPFSGPSMLRRYYGKVPFAPIAWVIAQAAPPQGTPAPYVLPGGFDLFFPPNTVVVGSVRYLPGVDLRVVAFTDSDEAAKRITDQLQAFLALLRALEIGATGGDSDLKQLFDSIRVEQDDQKAILNAELPRGLLKKVLNEPAQAIDENLRFLPERHTDFEVRPKGKTPKPKSGSKAEVRE